MTCLTIRLLSHAAHLRQLPGNAAEIELLKARAACEEKLRIISRVEELLAPPTTQDACDDAVSCWTRDGCMPSQAEAVVAAVLLLAGLQAREQQESFVSTIVEAGVAYDELGSRFSGASVGWRHKSAFFVQVYAALDSSTPAVLQACMWALERLCPRELPSLEVLRAYVARLSCVRVMPHGPPRDDRGNRTPLRTLLLVPAARLLQLHAHRMRDWLRDATSSPASSSNTPVLGEAELRRQLAMARADAASARREASKLRSTLKALQANLTASVRQREKAHCEKVERKVR